MSEDGPRNSVAEGEDGIEEEEEEKSEKSESESESSDEDTPFPCSNENNEDPMSVDGEYFIDSFLVLVRIGTWSLYS